MPPGLRSSHGPSFFVVSNTAPLGGWAEIVRSVHDGFGIITLILLILGTLVARISQKWKGQPIVVVAVIVWLLLLTTLIVLRVIPAPQTPRSQDQPTLKTKTVPRQADRTTGPLSFGCGETINVATPPVYLEVSAQQVVAQSEWVDMSNVKTHVSGVSDDGREGKDGKKGMKGTGIISGLIKIYSETAQEGVTERLTSGLAGSNRRRLTSEAALPGP